jgi:two-component system, OmpR family, sensor kinase
VSAPAGTRRVLASVRARIIASYVLIMVVGAVITVVAIRQLLIVRLDDRIGAEREQEIEEFRQLANEGVDPITGEPFRRDARRLFEVFISRNVPAEGEELIAVPRRGTPLYDYSARAEEVFREGATIDRSYIRSWRTLREPESGEIDTVAGPASYLAVPVAERGRSEGAFVVVTFEEGEREEVDEAVRIVGAVAGSVLLVGTVIAFFAAGRVLAPLRSLRDAARSISASDLTRRIEVDGNDELAALARTFNSMLDRLEHAFRSQREFVRDAGHELRTPITIIRGHIELLTGEPERMEETAAIVADELDRMSRFVDDLLLLAKAERPDFLELRTVSLDELTHELLAKAKQLGERDWVLDASSNVLVVADPQRLTQAVMNLADNAVHHTPERAEVGIGSDVRGQMTRLWVRDTGIGIAPGDRERIFSRFQRGLGGRRYEGSGLGLAIVRAIAEAHGGWVELTSEQGAGARFELVFPIDPEAAPARERTPGAA